MRSCAPMRCWPRTSGGSGTNNVARVLDYRGRRVLCAEQGPFGLALLAVTPEQQEAFGRASAGCVGSSDGWQDFARNGALTWSYEAAGPGNVALKRRTASERAILALGFGKQRGVGHDAGAHGADGALRAGLGAAADPPGHAGTPPARRRRH